MSDFADYVVASKLESNHYGYWTTRPILMITKGEGEFSASQSTGTAMNTKSLITIKGKATRTNSRTQPEIVDG